MGIHKGHARGPTYRTHQQPNKSHCVCNGNRSKRLHGTVTAPVTAKRCAGISTCIITTLVLPFLPGFREGKRIQP
jgi:hypothetical protein